ncbi:MAG TPA: CUAEP/CCAEP-tail radical SAM protein [Terriglobales bacterium]|nr:CUAEP/CCAEP-tail radical SAM protein [Terriglobales bacterium]
MADSITYAPQARLDIGRLGNPIEIVLISTYELGRQPFGLASPAAWLRRLGAHVTCLDLSLQHLDTDTIQTANIVAFYLPMHTATRMAIKTIRIVRKLNPRAHLCAYGLYAVTNVEYLRREGIQTALGGEFEEGLCELVVQVSEGVLDSPARFFEPIISFARQQFIVPDRSGLPPLRKYAQLIMPDGTKRVVGYTEATRGCKHECRHCPIVPVYEGKFRIVQREVVLADIRQQVAMGAEHITFGDPDFFNGIGHAIPLIEALHREFEHLSYDVTIKVEHLRKHADYLHLLRDTGCAFVTSAVESIDNAVLEIFGKNHTRDDFIDVARFCGELRLNFSPTFVTFTPWLSLDGYEDLLALLTKLNLAINVAPIQLAIRLLIPFGSRLLERSEVQRIIGPFDESALSYRWVHPDPRVDSLQEEVLRIVRAASDSRQGRMEVFNAVWRHLHTVMGGSTKYLRMPAIDPAPARVTIPYLTEPWYC